MKRIALFVAMILLSANARAENTNVVVSIKPLYSLAAAVMQGDGNKPVLLVSGKESLHSFTLKPSQRQAIEHAAVVFYISDSFETFLDKTLDSLPRKIQRVPMDKLNEMEPFLPARLGDGFEPHDHGHEEAHHHYDETSYDLHLWASVKNAKIMAMEIARQLSIAFPKKRELYFDNVRTLSLRLDALDSELQKRMNPLQGKPYIVFHDAFQYFEKSYGLTAVGSITMHPERGVSAKHLSEIRAKIKNAKAICVFREPQFDGRVVSNLVAGTGAKSGMLDPEGALLTPSPDLYFELMQGLATELETCLQ